MAGRISEEAKRFQGCAAGERIPAPKELLPAEAKVWDTIVGEKPAEWFTRDNVELLKLYCRSAVHLDWLKRRIEKAKKDLEAAEAIEDFDLMMAALKALDLFAKWDTKASGTFLQVSTKLRMTPQAQINPTATITKVKASAPKLWETGEAGENLYEEIDEVVGGMQ